MEEVLWLTVVSFACWRFRKPQKKFARFGLSIPTGEFVFSCPRDLVVGQHHARQVAAVIGGQLAAVDTSVDDIAAAQAIYRW